MDSPYIHQITSVHPFLKRFFYILTISTIASFILTIIGLATDEIFADENKEDFELYGTSLFLLQNILVIQLFDALRTRNIFKVETWEIFNIINFLIKFMVIGLILSNKNLPNYSAIALIMSTCIDVFAMCVNIHIKRIIPKLQTNTVMHKNYSITVYKSKMARMAFLEGFRIIFFIQILKFFLFFSKSTFYVYLVRIWNIIIFIYILWFYFNLDYMEVYERVILLKLVRTNVIIYSLNWIYVLFISKSASTSKVQILFSNLLTIVFFSRFCRLIVQDMKYFYDFMEDKEKESKRPFFDTYN